MRTSPNWFHAPSKGLHQSLLIAKETGCDAVQLFSRNPRGWRQAADQKSIDVFKRARRQTKLSPVLIRTILINLAAADEVISRSQSILFREELERHGAGRRYLVVHPGSARGCRNRCAGDLRVEPAGRLQGLRFGRLILLKTAARWSSVIAEHLRAIIDRLQYSGRLCRPRIHSRRYDIREADGWKRRSQSSGRRWA